MASTKILSGLAVALASLAAVALLFPHPLADAFFTAWVVFAVILAGIGAIGAWTRRRALLWVAALLLSGLSVIGMWSIGALLAPAAFAMLGAAAVSLRAAPRPGSRESILAEPPSDLDIVRRVPAGVALAALGAGLAYDGIVRRTLFTRGCLNETLGCALAVTRWDAVGLALVGLTAVAIGGRLIWRQVTIGWVLATAHER
ncbi:hypothetical protein [Halobellus rufus]|uniref:hypothetical protein n=1 Tax=Halobellus rufus TaxID=1448860 RepID=UPI000679D315|nr:hypothetical protein [Halobellus rufus]